MITKIPCGYVFSDQPLQYLSEAGFHLSIENLPELGCRRALIPLRDAKSQPTALLIYEVLDEEVFIRSSEFRNLRRDQIHLDPHVVEFPLASSSDTHPNAVEKLLSFVDSHSLQNEPWRLYFSIRKSSGLQAVILFSSNPKKLPPFDKEFEFEGKRYGLLSLGPQSFDILITF